MQNREHDFGHNAMLQRQTRKHSAGIDEQISDPKLDKVRTRAVKNAYFD